MAEVRVTQTGAYAESEGSAVQVTQLGAYAELAKTEIDITQLGVYAELILNEIRATQFGVYAELAEEIADVSTYAVRRAGGRAVHTRLPDEVTGYALDPAHSWWSVVVPEATENLIVNPSFEDGTTGYTIATLASSSVVTGDAIGATRGAYALQFANTASVQGGITAPAVTAPAGAYTFSLDVYVPRIGAQLIVRLSHGGGALSDKRYTFTRTGWQRIENTLVVLSLGAMSCVLLSPVENTVSYTFRTDGWQLENKRYSTSYADGDMTGWFDTRAAESYYWTGVPHTSTTVRKANTGTGGRVYYFSDLVKGVDFQTTAIVGAGMGPVELDTVRVGYEKEVHKGVRFMPRDFTITGRVIGCSYEELYQARQVLISYLRPNRTLRRQPLILRYQVTDVLGREASLPLEIIASYTDGLRGNITNLYQEAIGLQFHASVPYWMEEFESAIDLGATPYESLTSNRIIYRDADGVYQNLGTGTTDGEVLTVAFDADGTPLAGGAFTTLCGDAVNRIAQWNGTDWVNIDPSGGMDDDVNVIRVIPETNTIVAGGEFTIAGGFPFLRIAYFNGTAWNSLTTVETGFSSGEVNDLVYDRYSGRIFEVGASNNGTSFTYYAEIGDASWTSLPNGGLASVNCILSTHDGYIWIGGNFTETVDTTIQANRVIRYNIDTNELEPLDAGFNSSVFQLLQGRDGYVYATGFFSSDGNANYDLRHVARWNGSTWEEVNTAATTSIASPERAAFDANGILWYVNDALAFSHPAYDNQYMLGWSNNVEYPEPVVRPPITFGYTALAFWTNNEMLLAAAASDAAATFAPKQFTLTNGGDADALPVFILRNKQTPKFIQNLDAEVGIYFRHDLRIVDNERMFINLASSRPRFYSDTRPSLIKSVYTGASNLASFVLRPGENRIMLLCVDDDGAETVDNSLVWRQRFLSSDAVTAL